MSQRIGKNIRERKRMKDFTKKSFCVLLFVFGSIFAASAQKAAVKTNLLYDATATINFGIEIGLAPRWTLDLSGNYNPWTIRGHKWKHWLAQPELRYWFCERFSAHFIGIHAMGGMYNWANIKNHVSFLGSDFSGLTHYRYQGWAVGGGVAYGYDWILSKHWNLEFEVGVGYLYTRFDKFTCEKCGEQLENDKPHHYFGPTKAAINIVYTF